MNEKEQSKQQKEGANLFAAIKNIRANWASQIEVISVNALICKTKYDEAVAAGFTSEQALQICTKDWSF